MLGVNNFSPYDIRVEDGTQIPPKMYEDYLGREDVRRKIGAGAAEWRYCNGDVYERFMGTGDQARSFLGELEEVLEAGIGVLVWAGDAGEFLHFKRFLELEMGRRGLIHGPAMMI